MSTNLSMYLDCRFYLYTFVTSFSYTVVKLSNLSIDFVCGVEIVTCVVYICDACTCT